MATGILQLVYLLTICTVFHSRPVSSLRVEVTPPIVNELITDEVTVTCFATDNPDWTGRVVVIEIGKKGQPHVMALLRQTTTVERGPDYKNDDNIQVEGIINEQNTTQTYIKVRILNPTTSDGGMYSCQMFYIDEFGQLKQIMAYGSVSVQNENHQVVLVHLLAKMAALQDAVKQQETQLVAQRQQLGAQEKQINECNRENGAQNRRLQDQLKQIKEQDERASYTVAFSASYKTKDTYTDGKTLLFSNSILDMGNDYNVTTGVFTVPRDGLYVFHLTAMTYHYGWYVSVKLMADSTTLITLKAYGNDNDDQSSVSTVASLQAGQLVKPVMETEHGKHLDTRPSHSVFSGYLLKPF